MGLDEIWRNPLVNVDAYYYSTWYLKQNVDREVSNVSNRVRPMILYGVNELVRKLYKTKIEVDMVMEAEEKAREMGLIFNTEMWMRIIEKFGGRLPVRVQALPDGTWCPIGTPFMQIENTEDGFGELASYMETMLMRAYFASGCATEAFYMRKYLIENNLPLHRFHSFGMRGHRSQEDAYWAGTAWNLFLIGSDDTHTKIHTTADIKSISAGAHKVIQQFNKEYDAYIWAIDAVKAKGLEIVAFPIDTYDPLRFIQYYALPIATYAKQKGVHVVFRPDSGNLVQQTIDLYNLMKTHGLDKGTSVIIGEGMSLAKVKEFDAIFEMADVPLIWVNYGIGAGFYKHIDRDWLGWAMKTSYSNGANRMKLVKSNPIKQSIPGFVNIVRQDDGQLAVDYTRDHGLYVDIYHYNARSDNPEIFTQSWSDIQKIALTQTGTQERIVISPLIQQEIERIKQIYD